MPVLDGKESETCTAYRALCALLLGTTGPLPLTIKPVDVGEMSLTHPHP